jgi:tetratricopeptide (TPR) repeat protein
MHLVLAILLANAALDRGEALLQQGKAREAHAAFKEAVSSEPKNAAALAALGLTTLQIDRDVDRAVDLLERSVELDPKNARAHLYLGSAYGEKAQRGSIFTAMRVAGKVKDEFARAVELDPSWVDARMGLLQFYLLAPGIAGGSVDKAREQAEAIGRLDAARGFLAQATIAQHESEDPLPLLEKAVRAAGADVKTALPVRNQLGYALLRVKRVDEAIENFRAAVAMAPDRANPHDSLGDGLAAKGDLDAALASYRRALEIDPAFSSAWYGTAEIAEKKGQKADARRAWSKFLELTPKGKRAETARERLTKLAER